ncbi:flavin reductase family protein [Streptomyces shenzhenensis]|uniref:flavin reductase family protein n=1 Tax=Streptomyces shenzhenensis TaxID=943815 RepID=UPI0038D3757C
MAALAGGVCVVTALTSEGRPVGFTSTAVMSLSREPRLLAIGVGHRGRTLPALLRGGLPRAGPARRAAPGAYVHRSRRAPPGVARRLPYRPGRRGMGAARRLDHPSSGRARP